MALFRYPQPLPSEITPRETYLRRRALMGSGIAFLAGSSAKAMPLSARKGTLPATLSDGLSPTPKDDATHYNNFYEFGMDKSDPAENSASFQPLPWTLEIGGLVEKPLRLDLADMLRSPEIEERIYRMRCVEAWSMVIPWDGIPLASLLKAAGPSAGATHVAFEGVVRRSEMPGQTAALSGLEWPYVEGLRLDEAMHPLTLLALGMYGESLPNQNGAPVRLVVPWKYGFKGIKSITRIRLVDRQPPTTWNRLASDEYGFYANVNPDVDHPRWSQATERVIGSHALFGARRQPTLMFNGYAEQVAGMYRGMDLRRNF